MSLFSKFDTVESLTKTFTNVAERLEQLSRYRQVQLDSIRQQVVNLNDQADEVRYDRDRATTVAARVRAVFEAPI
jgi:uncharacterized protein Yka (UPF0111/DUF47 family)